MSLTDETSMLRNGPEPSVVVKMLDVDPVILDIV
jgi:hypothetical protein